MPNEWMRSLHAKHMQPTREMTRLIDVLVEELVHVYLTKEHKAIVNKSSKQQRDQEDRK